MNKPVCTTLSVTEQRALVRVFLGGMEALRTDSYAISTITMSSLCRKGYFGKHGLTENGSFEAKRLADSGLF